MNQYDLCEALNQYTDGSSYSFTVNKFTKVINIYHRGKYIEGINENVFEKYLLSLPIYDNIFRAHTVCLLNYHLYSHNIEVETIYDDQYIINYYDENYRGQIHCNFAELEKNIVNLLKNA